MHELLDCRTTKDPWCINSREVTRLPAILCEQLFDNTSRRVIVVLIFDRISPATSKGIAGAKALSEGSRRGKKKTLQIVLEAVHQEMIATWLRKAQGVRPVGESRNKQGPQFVE